MLTANLHSFCLKEGNAFYIIVAEFVSVIPSIKDFLVFYIMIMELKPVEVENFSLNALISAIKRKDEKAMVTLYDRYASAVFTSIIKILPNHKKSEEVLQKTFIKVWLCIELYDEQREPFIIWMHNIARNEAVDVIISTEFSQDLLNKSSHTASSNNELTHFENKDIRRVISQLNVVEKTIVALGYYRGLSCNEIAKVIHISEPIVKDKLQSVYSRVRNFVPMSTAVSA